MKKLLYFLLIILVLSFLTLTVIYAAYTNYKPENAVLMYHSIQPVPLNNHEDLYVSPENLEAQFKTINDSDISTLFLTEIDNNGIFITFDDGYEDNYTYAFPLIKKYNVKVTIFMIVDYIGHKGYLNEDQIIEMTESGLVSFQCHTATHQDLTSLDSEELFYEMVTSKEKLEAITGNPITAISYPYGKYNSTVLELAMKYYTVGVTTKGPNQFTQNGNTYKIPRYGISQNHDISYFSDLILY